MLNKTTDIMLEQAVQSESYPIPPGVFAETVRSVQHYTDRLFMFRISRPRSFRFRSGEFVMIGLPNAARPIYRAYSIASPSWDDELEFYSIKVPDGPLTKHLQKIQPGDTIIMRRKPTGTLVHDALLPGKRLYLFSTGTGIAPFASIVRDPETYDKFDRIVLTHTCRQVAELKYGEELIAQTMDDPLVGDQAKERLVHYPTTTQESSQRNGRITGHIASGRIFEELGLPPLSRTVDRCMICGSMSFLKDAKRLMEDRAFVEGSNSKPADYVVERAFVG
ncbi:MAG: ferredoxin--NADP reductase [Rhodobacteraceae bacterium]|nr:ferredoxin--NADP reductase [Paracoccaceae bacterium]